MIPRFLPDTRLEDMAGRLLQRYESAFGVVSSPPIPVERNLEDILDLSILRDDVSVQLHRVLISPHP